MREPIVIHCQCAPQCHAWIHVEASESDLIGTPGIRFVLPGHAGSDERICEIRRGYLVVQSAGPRR